MKQNKLNSIVYEIIKKKLFSYLMCYGKFEQQSIQIEFDLLSLPFF